MWCFKPLHPLPASFYQFLQLEHFSGCLDQTDYSQSLQYFDSSATDGQLTYDMFAPVARELILRVYQVRDTSGVSVCECVCVYVCACYVPWSLFLLSAVGLDPAEHCTRCQLLVEQVNWRNTCCR